MKKRKYICLTYLFLLTLNLQAQKLLDVYRNGIVRLTEVEEYGQKNNWEQIFFDYTKMSGQKQIGKVKNIAVAPDGSVFMSDLTTYTIAKFDKDGNFQKRFGQKGGKNKDFLYDPAISGVLDNKYVITYDLQGRIQLFTLNGDFVKLVKLDYIPNRIVPLKDSYVAIKGFVVTTKGSKQFIEIRNLDTGSKKMIWQRMDVYQIKRVIIGSNSYLMKEPFLFYSKKYYDPMIERNKKGELIVAFSESGEIAQYSPTGTLLRKFKSDVEPLSVSVEELKSNIERAKQQMEKEMDDDKLKPEEKEKMIKEYVSRANSRIESGMYQETMPCFSSFIVDSDDNLLLFEFSREKDNQFRVHTLDQQGKSVATSSFQSDHYSLSFIPGKFTFFNGCIYAVGMVKEGGGEVPLRLVKFEIKN
ncbi:MAG: hypothetical protein LBJ72_03380 [Dysgonamonadaceae bacterium]|jgi:hypothetical protein|nr:hypothetical protein [Dysgonamonadaceae bacterium]